MYEPINGTARLVNVLEQAAADPATVKRLAQLLAYYPEQLEQDIEALVNYWDKQRQERKYNG